MNDADEIRLNVEHIARGCRSDRSHNPVPYVESIHVALARLEAADEAQRDALTKALRLWPQDGSVHEPHCDVSWGRPCDCFTEIARAALAETGLE